MKHISLLIPEGDSSLSNLEATYKMFSMTNKSLEQIGKQPLFNIQLVGINLKARLSNGIFSVTPDITIAEVKQTDLIIIPAIHGEYRQVIEANREFVPWIMAQFNKGAEVASLCIGAFLLASTGLLDGKKCATHWLAAKEFRELFPDVELIDDKIITDEQGIYTSGGAYSSLNLNLYLLEKYAGREMAVLSSKIFEIDISRNNQLPFIIFKGQKDHEDEAIKKAQELIEESYREKLTIDDLCEKKHLGRRTLERRFKKATSNSVTEYIQRVKIEATKRQLESSPKSVGEIRYDVGYSDVKSFRTVFKKITGLTPVDYRNRYQQVGMC